MSYIKIIAIINKTKVLIAGIWKEEKNLFSLGGGLCILKVLKQIFSFVAAFAHDFRTFVNYFG